MASAADLMSIEGVAGPPADLTLPEGLERVRTTPRFDQDSVPAGLLNEHRVADGVWGRLIVHDGALRFVFDAGRADSGATSRCLTPGSVQVIPPAVVHHVELVGPVDFEVEFWRAPGLPGADRVA